MFESLAAQKIIRQFIRGVSDKQSRRIKVNSQIIALLVQHLKDNEKENRIAAAKALGTLGGQSAVEPLIGALADSEDRVRCNAARSLGLIKDIRAIEPLISALCDKGMRDDAAWALGMIGDPRALIPLFRALGDPDSTFRHSAALALLFLGESQWHKVVNGDYVHDMSEIARMDDPRTADALIRALESSNESVVQNAARALSGSMERHAVEPLLSAFQKRSTQTRHVILEAFVRLNDPCVIGPLTEAMREHRKYQEPVRHINDYDEWETLEDRDEADLIREALEKIKTGSH